MQSSPRRRGASNSYRSTHWVVVHTGNANPMVRGGRDNKGKSKTETRPKKEIRGREKAKKAREGWTEKEGGERRRHSTV